MMAAQCKVDRGKVSLACKPNASVSYSLTVFSCLCPTDWPVSAEIGETLSVCFPTPSVKVHGKKELIASCPARGLPFAAPISHGRAALRVKPVTCETLSIWWRSTCSERQTLWPSQANDADLCPDLCLKRGICQPQDAWREAQTNAKHGQLMVED